MVLLTVMGRCGKRKWKKKPPHRAPQSLFSPSNTTFKSIPNIYWNCIQHFVWKRPAFLSVKFLPVPDFIYKHCYWACLQHGPDPLLCAQCLLETRGYFVCDLTLLNEVSVEITSSCRGHADWLPWCLLFRPYSPQGAGLIPSWMTPTFWFTVTFPILFIGKRMAIFFPRWALMYLNTLFSFLNWSFFCHAIKSTSGWHKGNFTKYWIE